MSSRCTASQRPISRTSAAEARRMNDIAPPISQLDQFRALADQSAARLPLPDRAAVIGHFGDLLATAPQGSLEVQPLYEVINERLQRKPSRELAAYARHNMIRAIRDQSALWICPTT